jgi:adenylate kinase
LGVHWDLEIGPWDFDLDSVMLHLVLIGPPGSGKGTQAVRIARRYKVPHISTGDILRQAVRDDTPLGREVAATIASGSLVSDELISNLVEARLGRADAATGFLLDGFPRTPAQAQLLDSWRPDLIVVHFDVPDAEIVRRLGTRRVCQSCSLTQSVSEEDGRAEDCPYCGGTLARRDDDEPATVRKRLATYAAFAEPLLAIYRSRRGFVTIDGVQPPDRVSADLFGAIDAIR